MKSVYVFFLLFLFSCSKSNLKRYEYFSNGKISAFNDVEEDTKRDSYRIEYYSNGKVAKVYRYDGFVEYYDELGNLVFVYDVLLEKYKTVDGKFANRNFKFVCRENTEEICEKFTFENGVLQQK